MNDQEMRLAREYRPTMDGEVLAAWAKDAASALARMSARCEDAAREIDKAVSVLDAADRMMTAEAEMNAAKHMSERVIPNPLAAAIATALADLRAFRGR